MTALPSSSDFSGSAVTEGQFKTAINNQRDFLAGLLGTTGNQIDALIAIGALGADTVSKTANYTVTATDRGKAILCDGTFNINLTTAETLGDGFSFVIINTGSGLITIDPSSAEQIDGSNTKIVAANSSLVVFCNGSAFYTLGSGGISGLNYVTFTSNGNWTVPAGVTKAFVRVIGGGGAGGSAQYSGSKGGKGGNGGDVCAYFSTLNLSYSITIGAGGNAVAGGHNAYNNAGASSSFGSEITCNGGSGGQNNAGGNAGAAGTNGSVTVSSGIRINDIVPTLHGTNWGNGGAGAANSGSASNIVGENGSAGIICIIY